MCCCFYDLGPFCRDLSGESEMVKTFLPAACILGSEERPWDCSGQAGRAFQAPELNLHREETESRMEEAKRQQNASMWHEIDGLQHQTVGQLKVKYREVFGQESRSNHKQFLMRTHRLASAGQCRRRSVGAGPPAGPGPGPGDRTEDSGAGVLFKGVVRGDRKVAR